MGLTDKLAQNITKNLENSIDDKLSNVLNELTNTPPQHNDSKTELSIDDIKKALKGESLSQTVESVYEETNKFYNENMKTSTLKNMLNKVEGRVLDKTELFTVSTVDNVEKYDKTDLIETEEGYTIEKKQLDRVLKEGILNNRINIKVNIVGTRFILEGIYNYQIKKGKDYIDIIYPEYIERRHKNKIEILKKNNRGEWKVIPALTVTHELGFLIFSYEFNVSLMSYGLLEFVLAYSETFSVIQKDIKTGSTQVFVDEYLLPSKHYLRENYMKKPRRNPVDISAGDNNLIESVTPATKIDSYSQAKEMLQQEISSLLQMDKTILFSTQTAEATKIASNQTIDTINRIKQKYQEVINKFLIDLLGTDMFKYDIEEYVVKNEEVLYNNVSKAVTGSFMTIKRAVYKTMENSTQDEKDTEYLTLMYQKGIPFSAEEEERARELNILSTEF